jgi:N-acetylneuraminic acid mutarotase
MTRAKQDSMRFSFRRLFVPLLGSACALILSSCGGATEPSGVKLVPPPVTQPNSSKAPLPEARAYFQVAVVNNVIYAMGGMAGGETTGVSSRPPSNAIWAYSPASNTWSATGANSLRPGQWSAMPGDAVGVVNGVIYSTNGAALDAFTPATDTWTSKAPLPTKVDWPAVGVVDGIVYVIGVHSTAGQPTVLTVITQAYDPATNTWVSKASPPSTNYIVTRRGLVGLNGTLYMVDASTRTGRLFAYAPATDTWTERAPMGIPRTQFAFASLNGSLYAAGGFVSAPSRPGDSMRRGIVEAYDPATNRWTTLPSLSVARDDFGLAAVNGFLYAIGGDIGQENTAFSATDANEAFAP